jgi:hypothetical protein
MRNHTLSPSGWIPRLSLRTATLTTAVGLVTALFAGAAISWAAPASQALAGTPCTQAAKACVDLDSMQAWLVKDGQVHGPVSISTGETGMETPRGNFRVLRKVKDFYSTEYDAPMPYSVFFAPGGVAFHEGDVDSKSAGCVHLAHDDAVAFFNTLQVGDPVEVH